MHTHDKYLLVSLLLLPSALYAAHRASRAQSAPPAWKYHFTAAQTAAAFGETNLARRAQPVTLIEFGDYQCPPCKQLAAQLKAMPLLNGDRSVFIFRNLPLTTLHPHAYRAACLAEAARLQGKFDAMHDLLYLNDGRNDDNAAQQYAQALGLDLDRLRRDAEGAGRRQVQRDMDDAQILGLRSTPTLLLCRPGKAPERVLPQELALQLTGI